MISTMPSPPAPLAGDAGDHWHQWIAAVGPATMLVLIDKKIHGDLRRTLTAEDVWQEALLRAWRARHRSEWREVAAFRRWLLQVAINVIRDAVDARATRKRGGDHRTIAIPPSSPSTDGQPAMAEPARTTTPSRIASLAEQARAMQRALTQLPSHLRTIVWQRLFEDATVEQIAARLAIGQSAVRHRFRKGAELYRAALRREQVMSTESIRKCDC